jgi:hypothetical protein
MSLDRDGVSHKVFVWKGKSSPHYSAATATLFHITSSISLVKDPQKFPSAIAEILQNNNE